ncbi:MAG: hypothetical protein D6806_11760, partial [Deltaproteobacteria bacterium]
MKRLRILVAVAALAVAAVSGAQQLELSKGEMLLKEAKILYDNLQYDQALAKLKKAIRAKNLKKTTITEIYKYMGSIYIIQGRANYAKRAFELLLKIDPNYEMNPLLTSPKILSFFNKVKEEVRSRQRVIMNHTPLKELPASDRIEVRAYVVDIHNRLRSLKVYFRRRGDKEYSVADMVPAKSAGKGARTYVGYIPFIWTVTDEVELFVDYYLAGVDRKGRWVANIGNPKEPLTFRINLMQGKLPEGARRTPLLKAWWFWSLVG